MSYQYFFSLLLFIMLSNQALIAGDDDHKHHDHEDHHLHSEHEDDFTEHGSHVHGEALANIVFSKEELSINITLPALNAFGFEHEPKNEIEEQHTQQIIQQLKQPASVLTINEQCKIELADVISESDHEHYDVVINYQYHCHDVQEIELKFIYFDQLHELEKITVQYISDHAQNLFTITQTQPTISLH